MGDIFQDRVARPKPPRVGECRVVACNAATTAVEIDNDLFQLATAANAAATPGSLGRALCSFFAESDDVWIVFGQTSNVVANSAATSGNTVAEKIPAGKERVYELSPAVDKFFSARTLNGGSNTTNLRYRLVSSNTRTMPT